jgi:hypothetical protein
LRQQQRQRPGALSATELQALWTELGTQQTDALLDTSDRLVEAPDATLAFLQPRLAPVSTAGLEDFLADLDAGSFAKRDKAMHELGRMEFAAASALERVLAGHPTLEVRRRVEKLLQQLQEPTYSLALLASWRAITVLEQINTPQARDLLETLAKGAAGARLTREAQSALQRLAGVARDAQLK